MSRLDKLHALSEHLAAAHALTTDPELRSYWHRVAELLGVVAYDIAGEERAVRRGRSPRRSPPLVTQEEIDADRDFANGLKCAPPSSDADHREASDDDLYPCGCPQCRYLGRWAALALAHGVIEVSR